MGTYVQTIGFRLWFWRFSQRYWKKPSRGSTKHHCSTRRKTIFTLYYINARFLQPLWLSQVWCWTEVFHIEIAFLAICYAMMSGVKKRSSIWKTSLEKSSWSWADDYCRICFILDVYTSWGKNLSNYTTFFLFFNWFTSNLFFFRRGYPLSFFNSSAALKSLIWYLFR